MEPSYGDPNHQPLHTTTYTHAHMQVQSAQEVFAINVDLHRNRVLRTTLLLTMLSTSFASAATVASFLGSWVVYICVCFLF
jgi:hypothetical protein